MSGIEWPTTAAAEHIVCTFSPLSARGRRRLQPGGPPSHAVCDPVMGDDGELYCRPELPPAFGADIVPIASVVTPNQVGQGYLSSLRRAPARPWLAFRTRH